MNTKILTYAVILFIGSCTVTADTGGGCDPGWINANGNCYLFNNQKLITWQQSRDECNRQEASLLRINSQSELTWYTGYVSNYPSSGYWTALNDIPSSGASNLGTNQWKWGSYQYANMSLISWNQSPANDGVANCAGVNIQGKLADWNCKARQGYICELKGPLCPLGWMNSANNCYYVSDTTDPSQLLTYQNAINRCKQLNSTSTLMNIDDADDQNFLIGQLPYITKSALLHWVGLQYSKTSGQWTWMNGATYQNNLVSWVSEPDNVNGVENCAVVRQSGTFSDRSCNTTNNYICKKPQDPTTDDSNVGCGLWIRAGHNCYEFYTDPKSTWDDARSRCRSMQGDLINVKSLDQKVWLTQQMLDPGFVRVYWTGLNDKAKESNYVWSDGTPLDPSTISWNQEPNDYLGNEDCAVIYNNGQYNDISCTNKAAAICELDGAASCPSTQWVSRAADKGTGLNCYLFTAYSNTSTLFTNSEAMTYCKGFAQSKTLIPKLLSVDTASEKSFIKSKLNAFTADNPYGWYTGLNDKQSEGYWSFSGSNMPIDPTLIDWQGEPSSRTPDSDCVMVNYAGAYHDIQCNSKLGFICQRAAYLPWTSGTEVRSGHKGVIALLAIAVYACVHALIIH